MKLASFASSNKSFAPAKMPYAVIRNFLISIFAITALTGCLVADEPALDINTSEHEALNFNALNFNALNFNALNFNALNFNALTTDSLTNGGSLLLDNVNAGSMPHTDSGREVLQYIARCALPAEASLEVQSGWQTWHFPGMLGIAPEWTDGPLDEAGQQVITACLLAHVNFFGEKVLISVRSDRLAEADPIESSNYFYGDGAFYGNLFEDPSKKYACKIRSTEVYDADLGEYVPASSPDADKRICAGEDTAADCGFVFSGYCDEVCTDIVSDGDQWRFSNCRGADGASYSNAVTVWLEGGSAESCASTPAGYTCDPK